ncbi:MAG: MBL fold metallo-hydrolase [Pseudomonadota bacterium]|jgi:Zn-dependent hydrolases, including glyoxylases|nr:MAG: hypothetical protein DIU56_08235 [Pseudomonadota bacterium]
MSSLQDRRRFLRTALGCAAGLPLMHGSLSSAFAREPKPSIEVTRLTDDIAIFSGAGGNVVAARDADGLVLVDGGMRGRSRELLDAVTREMGEKRIRALFNTHWHPEQTGSNERLGKQGVKIIAHENTKLWLGTQITPPWSEKPFEPLPPAALPNETTYDVGELPFGDDRIRYGYLPQAHTDGDIYVYFPKANVLVTGGVVSGAGWPLIDWYTGGWIGGLANGLRTLVGVANAETRVVPADGPVLTRADLEAQQKMYSTIFGRLQQLLRKGLSPDEAADTGPAQEFEDQWGDSREFVITAFKSLWGPMSPDA